MESKLKAMHRSETQLQRLDWDPHRVFVADLIELDRYQFIVGFLVSINTLFIIRETNLRASDLEVDSWTTALGWVFLFLYSVDLLLRLYVYRRSFFYDVSNWIDFIIIVADIIAQALSPIIGRMLPLSSVLRVCRLAKLLRCVRILRMFRELNIMLMGFMSAMRAIFWASLMLFVIVTWFSIIAVEVLHPITTRLTEQGTFADCERCQRAFSSVYSSNLTFLQQIIAGDSWGQVSLPIIEEEPLAGILLVGVLFVVQMGVINLILTVIVDVASSVRESDEALKLKDKAQEYDVVRKKLLDMCIELDSDGSGLLTMDELFDGLGNNPRFAQHMALLDIGEEDMQAVFSVLDEDHSGSVAYKEFVDQLHKMKCQDSHVTLIFIKSYLNEVRCHVNEQLHILRDEVLSSNIDMSSSLQKILFGGALCASPSPTPTQPEVKGVDGALTRVQGEAEMPPGQSKCKDTGGKVGEAEVALSTGPSSPYLRTDGDTGLVQPCVSSQHHEEESFFGMAKLQDTLLHIEAALLRLEKHVGSELAQLTGDATSNIGEQLALVQDWGPSAWNAALSGLEAEPFWQSADAKGSELHGSDRNLAPARKPSEQVKLSRM